MFAQTDTGEHLIGFEKVTKCFFDDIFIFYFERFKVILNDCHALPCHELELTETPTLSVIFVV